MDMSTVATNKLFVCVSRKCQKNYKAILTKKVIELKIFQSKYVSLVYCNSVIFYNLHSYSNF